jgi:hypothetical protein
MMVHEIFLMTAHNVAGVLALPKAFSTVGLVPGLVVVAVAATLTYCSSVIITSAAVATQLPTYGAIIKARFGRNGARLLQLAIILHVGGAGGSRSHLAGTCAASSTQLHGVGDRCAHGPCMKLLRNGEV